MLYGDLVDDSGVDRRNVIVAMALRVIGAKILTRSMTRHIPARMAGDRYRVNSTTQLGDANHHLSLWITRVSLCASALCPSKQQNSF